jgi:hypothetical protein
MKELTTTYKVDLKDREITEFERRNVFPLPLYFRSFLLKYNGASVKETYYNGKPTFSSFLALVSERNSSIEKVIEAYKTDLETDQWLPFASDSGGWVYCISIAPETLNQVWVDRFDSGEENPFRFVAPSFEEFINGLEPG